MLFILFIFNFFIMSVCILVLVICFKVSFCIISVRVWLFVILFMLVIIGINIVNVIICCSVVLKRLIN